MTPSEWLDIVSDTMLREADAGSSINHAASEAIDSLICGWEENVEDNISCTVIIHDLKEVAARLIELHDELAEKLPGVLDEMANI